MTRIAVIGAAGRMGRAITRFAHASDDVTVTAGIEQSGHPELGKDLGVLAGIEALDVPLADDPVTLKSADVLIDFTVHSAAPRTVQWAVDAGKGAVIGSTGLDEAEQQALKEASLQVPVLWAPNMSFGINLLCRLVATAAKALGSDYDIEIVETHHRHKKDAPSGTALLLGNAAAAGRRQALKACAVYGRQGHTGERPAGEIGIHALRGGDVVGDHTVLFAADGERIELSHRASTRDTFAQGAVRAAAWLHGKDPGMYDMNNVLGL